MATVSPIELNQKVRAALKDIGENKTRRLVDEILIGIAAYASTMTPVKTSFLVNSQYRRSWTTATGYEGEIGYGAKYAIYVHEAPGTLLGASVLRSKSRPGWGYVWDPNGEPRFLRKGVDEYVKNDLSSAIKRIMSV